MPVQNATSVLEEQNNIVILLMIVALVAIFVGLILVLLSNVFCSIILSKHNGQATAQEICLGQLRKESCTTILNKIGTVLFVAGLVAVIIICFALLVMLVVAGASDGKGFGSGQAGYNDGYGNGYGYGYAPYGRGVYSVYSYGGNYMYGPFWYTPPPYVYYHSSYSYTADYVNVQEYNRSSCYDRSLE